MLGRTASLLMALLLVPAVAYAWTAWPGNDPGWEVNGCPTGGGYSCQADLEQERLHVHYCQTGVETMRQRAVPSLGPRHARRGVQLHRHGHRHRLPLREV